MKITSTMIVAVGARRCRLEGGRDARVGEPDAQGQQPAEQRARRQHISSVADRPVVVRRRPRRHGIVSSIRAQRDLRTLVRLNGTLSILSLFSGDSLSHSRAHSESTPLF